MEWKGGEEERRRRTGKIGRKGKGGREEGRKGDRERERERQAEADRQAERSTGRTDNGILVVSSGLRFF